MREWTVVASLVDKTPIVTEDHLGFVPGLTALPNVSEHFCTNNMWSSLTTRASWDSPNSHFSYIPVEALSFNHNF